MTLALLITAVGGAWAQKRGGINDDASVAKARIMAKTPRRALAIPENATILYQQNFDGTNDINELGWTFVDNDGDEGNWMMSINGKYDMYEDSPSKTSTSVPNSLYSQSYTDDGEDAFNADNWAITPAIEIYESSILSFQLAYGNYTYPDKVGVYVGETANVNEMTEVLALTSFSRTDHLQFNEETVDLSAFAGKTCYIAFRHKDYDNYVVFIDDVTVYTTDPRFYSFTMPASDVTVNYELVRDMSVQMTTKVGDGADGADYRIRLKKKDGNKWEPAELTVAQVMEKFKVHDAIENKDLAFYGEGAVCAISIYAADDNDLPTGNAIDFADLEPGRYVAVATAADGSAYDGSTEPSNVLVLYEGFPVVVPATEEEGGEVDLGTVSFYTEQFNLKLETGSSAKLYTLTAIDGHTVTATEVDVVPAGMPFFVLNETDAEQMVTLLPATAEEVTTTPTPIIEFLGTDVDLTFTQEDMDGAYDYYILHRGIFVWVKDPGTLKAGKCYLRILKGQPTTARRIVFSEATGLRAIENGKLTIENEAGAVYDLSGRKLDGVPTRKGIYIHNGKKVVVK